MNSDEAYISRVLESLFSGLRYTRYRTDAQTGKLNSDGSLNTNVSDGLAPPYIWVRFGEDRAAVPILSKIRDGAGLPVIVAFDTLINEDVVLEVNLARAVPIYGDSATAYNIPTIPAGFFTPTNARDVQPGSLRADTSGGLNARIVPCWLPWNSWWDGGTIITLVPTATSSKQTFVVVGINSTGTVVQELTADRALTYPLIDADGVLTNLGAADIQAVTAADLTVFWSSAVLLANGATSIDGSRIYDRRFWSWPTMTGANGSNAGASGLVPAPAAADNTKYLKGDGTYDTPGAGGGAHSYVGYNTAGGSTETMTLYRQYMTKVTLASDGFIMDVGAYIKPSAAGNVMGFAVAVMSDNAGTPDEIISHTAWRAGYDVLLDNSYRWVSMPASVWCTAGDYWLAIMDTGAGGSRLDIAYDGSGADKYYPIGNAWMSGADGGYTATATTNKYSIRASVLTL